jgi:hypothetical protein
MIESMAQHRQLADVDVDWMWLFFVPGSVDDSKAGSDFGILV